MAKARTKMRGVNLPVPQNREEAAAALRRVGELGRDLVRHEADMNDTIARLKEEAELAAEPLRAEKDGLVEGLRTWSEANRAALTDGNKVKYADLGTGKILWRFRPPKITGVPKDPTGLIERLRALGFERFVRVKEEVDREAMLADPQTARAIPGIRVASEGEDFVVEPYEAELRGAA